MTIFDNAKEKDKDLANLIQETFPGLDVWYVNSYTLDENAREANIQIRANCGHFGIGLKDRDRTKGKSRTKVPMKIYNIESRDCKTFFFDKERLEKEGVNIEKSITYQFSHIECLKGFLDERTQQDIINKINQKHPTPKPISEPEPPAPTTNREQGNRVW